MAVNITQIKDGTVAPASTPNQRSDLTAQTDIFGEEGEAEIIAPRFVYSKLGNLTDNKNITEEDAIPGSKDFSMKSEETMYKKFMMDMNRFSKTGISINNIDKIDSYLGKLGVVKEYPFKDDTYFISKWFENTEDDGQRNVIYGIKYPWDTIQPTIKNVVYGFGQRASYIKNVVHNTRN